MDIVRAFTENELHTEIIIKGDVNNPLFRASDIGNVLDISNIRTSINDFNETEKVVHSMDTLGGTQQVTFLTEKGLYKVLFKSRKQIAEKFQNWVCEIIKEIRLNGIYDLQKEIEKQNIELEQLENTKNKELEDKLIKQKIMEREKILLHLFSFKTPILNDIYKYVILFFMIFKYKSSRSFYFSR
jgi:prophage antirepressor-like protein